MQTLIVLGMIMLMAITALVFVKIDNKKTKEDIK